MLQNKEAWLQQSKLAKMLCKGHREFALTDGGFCRKQTLYILDYVNISVYDVYFDCEPSIQSYASLVFLGMHASRKVQSWQKVSHLLE